MERVGQEQVELEPGTQAGNQRSSVSRYADHNPALDQSKSGAYMQRRLVNKLQVRLIGGCGIEW